MSQKPTPLPHWKTTSLTTSTRPQLNHPTELEIQSHSNVGIYQGNSKILNYQKCRVYLTNQRLIFVRDGIDANVNESFGNLGLVVNLGDIKNVEYIKGFMRSSAKIIIYLKRREVNESSDDQDMNSFDVLNKKQKEQQQQFALETIWVCPICFFVNSINVNFNLDTQRKSCDNCGVFADKDVLLNAIKEAMTESKLLTSQDFSVNAQSLGSTQEIEIGCPKCTFINHKSLTSCELCGSLLPSSKNNQSAVSKSLQIERALKVKFEFELNNDGLSDKNSKYIKLSFREVRDSSDKKFYLQLKETIEKAKWNSLLDNGNINKNSQTSSTIESSQSPHELLSTPVFGIHSLTIKESVKSQQNQYLLTSSVDDFSKIINNDSQLQSLLESFTPIINKQLRETHNKVHQHTITTKQLSTSNQSISTSEITLQELAYRIQDHLAFHKPLKITPLTPITDLYVSYNRTLPFQSKISPTDLVSVLPILTSSKSSYQSLIIPGTTQIAITSTVQSQLLQTSITNFISTYGIEDAYSFKRANLIQVAQFFKWGVGLSQYVMDLAVQEGVVVMDVGLEGAWFYLNEFEEIGKLSLENLQDDGNDGSGQVKETEGVEIKNKDLFLKGSLFDLEFPVVPRMNPVNSNPDKREEITVITPKSKSKNLMDLEGLMF